ncbi:MULTISPECIES: TetR/AcrR family transcriptional regulator [unclassified Crossiella]|uniref:TetR/AcrR family transcriptional regulator n=1 Tax=unclassified Crossiella TaxID=2620835 RepID=UPI001FFE611C|nr:MULTISPECIES: TetR/AcrR family transcriptional regulator [unclassified Crossiella]MCK2239878.1 TetR/AcrR family transcriptional regulator [Crossiella sp. S99.2]MCK2252586.1 TetR/AcrR family transcriptional regulator [Crossiella sp. S99.1]
MTVTKAAKAPPAAERIRQAALTLFAAKGFHGTGIRDLAETAGLSSASLYHYMGTKEDLLLAIMRECMTRLLTAGRRVFLDDPDPRSRLAGLVQVHVLSHAVHPLETAVVDNELRALSATARAGIVAQRDEYEDLWRAAIEDGCASGVFRTSAPAVTRLALLEMCSGVARWYSPRGRLALTELATHFTEIAYGALHAEPSTVDVEAARRRTRLVTEVWGVPVRR